MISEIKYNGFSASPSDYESLDGDLAAVVGLVPENGALKPIPAPKPIFTLNNGQRVVVLHKTSSFTHYIIQNEANNLYWRSESGALTSLCNLIGKQVFQITTIGNTVIALCDDGMHYMLWKNGDYTYLGNKIPECPISFGLWGKGQLYSELTGDNNLPYGTFTINYNNLDDKETIASQVLPKVNKFIADAATGDNKFMYPFFVRYAYRLYDGSLTHHSAPILMLPSTEVNPIVFAPSAEIGDTSSTLDIYSIVATLDYQPLMSEGQRSVLNNWSDIVKSVDIFISAPIYTYDMSGVECEYKAGVSLSNYFHGRFVPKGGGVDDALMGSTYQRWAYYQLYPYDYGTQISRGFNIPSFPSSEVDAKIRDCSNFYLLTSINIEDLPFARTNVKIEDGSLSSLVAREVMTDDYQTHDTLIPSFAQVYNSRMNIANIERKLFNGYDTASQVAYSNGYLHYNYIENTITTDPLYNGAESVILYTKVQGDKTITLENTCATPLSSLFWNYPYLFYPDINAKQVTIYREDGTYKTLTLEPHPLLNGAVYFNKYQLEAPDAGYFSRLSDANPTISLPNKIYTSEINNPFHFPLNGINTIGTGEIVGISTAAKALSEGQFGQFPLYAFATDGVWALEVSATGNYSAKQPITRDVCLSKDSITQIDSSVLFATDRGIMLLSGSQSICISDILDSAEPFALAILPQSERLLIDFASLAASNATYIPFREFIAGCRMIYDYVQQRIVVINPNCQYAYVYSFESKAWGIMPSTLKSTVNSYPDALAMDGNNRLVDISKPNSTTDIPIFFVTRPIKIEADILKTIDTIIQRGYFKRGHVKMALYGSRDMFDWFLVSSSTDQYLRGFRGTPYKYFRIAVLGTLDHNESITGATIQYTPRQINQPR